MPITWRNVQGNTDFRGASAMLAQAGKGMRDGIQSIRDALQEREDINEQNWQNTKQNNTNALLDRLNGLATPEQLAELQASGELQRMQQGFGAQYDATAVRQALSSLPETLQQRVTTANQYADAQTSRSNDPMVNDLFAAAYAGDREAMTRLDELNDPRERTLLGDMQGIYDNLDDRAMKDKEFNLRQQESGQRLRLGGLQIKQAEQSEAERLEKERLNSWIGEQTALGRTASQMRGDIVSGKAGEYSSGVLSTGLDGLDGQVERYTGLTQAQQSAFDSQMAPVEEQSALEIARAERQRDSLLSQYPVNDVKAYTADDFTPTADAYAAIAKATDGVSFGGNTFKSSIQGAGGVNGMLREMVGDIDKEFSTLNDGERGLAMMRAFSATGTTETLIGDDRSINGNTFANRYREELRSLLEYKGHSAERERIEKEHEERVNLVNSNLRTKQGTLRNSLLEENIRLNKGN